MRVCVWGAGGGEEGGGRRKEEGKKGTDVFILLFHFQFQSSCKSAPRRARELTGGDRGGCVQRAGRRARWEQAATEAAGERREGKGG